MGGFRVIGWVQGLGFRVYVYWGSGLGASEGTSKGMF